MLKELFFKKLRIKIWINDKPILIIDIYLIILFIILLILLYTKGDSNTIEMLETLNKLLE
ncbi:hypothetical protein ACTQ5K_08725 [Niallia sp. Sow4_A1]|uniref:hypothetical protein n=1 Tax=unclassified Niallia TaxID=2837522 RepID=UPI00203AD927|nr:hypothetical protein [Niallia sp. MER TA 168]MCM3364221.1 hypothetical protein [Niallia sp. MER TA 168]